MALFPSKVETTGLAVIGLICLCLSPIVVAKEPRQVSDDLGRTVLAPQKPKRIAAGADETLATILLELQAPLIASTARVDPSTGALFMKGPPSSFGVTLESAEITVVAINNRPDFEALAAAAPDLIVVNQFAEPYLNQLSLVAPTFIAIETPEPWATHRSVARALGLGEDSERLQRHFEMRLNRARERLDLPNGTTYSAFTMNVSVDGIQVDPQTSISYIAEGLGLSPNTLMEELSSSGDRFSTRMSLERFPELDADYIFVTFREAGRQQLEEGLDRLDQALPTWCQLLSACREGRIIVFSDEVAVSPSFVGYSRMLDIAMSHLVSHRVRQR
ncbi:ABC transporter substrate-binding protein [Algihabitans sp.]|uniref:ABC transporter substrate-binding protein n=1 Tax=Algihabitans sp. TaxID=2821514 RepID=UPI003BA9FD33